MIEQIQIVDVSDEHIQLEWKCTSEMDGFNIYWSDTGRNDVVYKCVGQTQLSSYTFNRSTHIPHYFKIAAVKDGEEVSISEAIKSPIKKFFASQRERLNRGLIAVATKTGIFLSWRLMIEEVTGFNKTGMTGHDFQVYRNDELIATVTDSTNYLDIDGSSTDIYHLSAVSEGLVMDPCPGVKAFESGANYIDIPLQIPEDGMTPKGDTYSYNANDMSIADVDGDGEYEFILKWDPSNSQDVSIKGYTGNCYIDCYKLSGHLMWRLDMGVNIRSGAHYTQFMVYDFDGDQKAEMSVKTAPGTKMTTYHEDGTVKNSRYITLPQKDLEAGVSHDDHYVCSANDYRRHLIQVFMGWHEHPEVLAGQWPTTLEACFGIESNHTYPLTETSASELVDYFLDVYAPGRSPKNQLREFEGFIYEGPEYLTMFGGDGEELETIPFKYAREDDGLLWGDYSMKRIEPCNRVDRFLSGVAYLDGEKPFLIVARGYYTRTTLVAYKFVDGHHEEYFAIDSGHVPMDNPFNDNAHAGVGTDPVYGILAGQGNHSLATADVDGDGKQEIIYGACVIDHDGSVLYSSYDIMPDGSVAKMGHGDAMHVANINPNKPGLEIFSVFEGGVHAPYGYALRDAETGKVIFGEYATVDLGRCMVGDINPKIPGLQVWVKEVYDCLGNPISDKLLGTNQSIRWAADLSTQILDGVDYVGGQHSGVINDNTHGIMLAPEDVKTNNGTKGNPCLIADVFGDFREELLVRKADNTAIRIFTNVEITKHKLFTPMHDIQYRTGVAWQNNCYNQPGYTSFYYGSDMDFGEVLPSLHADKIVEDSCRVFLAGDSTVRTDETIVPARTGWGQMIPALYDHRVVFYNHAKAGRGTKNFENEGRFQAIIDELQSDDYVLIQFAHNDQKSDDPNRFVEPYREYKDNLHHMIDRIKAKGAIPLLVTPVVLRQFNQQDQLEDFHKDYLIAMKQVAEEAQVQMIDLEQKSRELLVALGSEASKALFYHLEADQHPSYPEGLVDDVHFNSAGALTMAILVAEEVERLGLAFSDYRLEVSHGY